MIVSILSLCTHVAALSLWQQLFKLTGKLSHHRLANAYGAAAVTSASLVTSLVSVTTRHHLKGGGGEYSAAFTSLRPLCLLSCSSAAAVVYFFVFSASFRCALPSSLLRPGAFAIRSEPQSDYGVAVTSKQRKIVQGYGYRYGCHTCGKVSAT